MKNAKTIFILTLLALVLLAASACSKEGEGEITDTNFHHHIVTSFDRNSSSDLGWDI